MFSSRNAQDRTWSSLFGVLMLSMVLGLSACSSGSSDSNDDLSLGEGGDFATAVPSSWEDTAKPLLQRCWSTAYSDSGSHQAPFALDTYEQVFNKRADIRLALLSESCINPPATASQLTEEELAILFGWLDSIEPPPADGSNLNYDRLTGDYNPLIPNNGDPYCENQIMPNPFCGGTVGTELASNSWAQASCSPYVYRPFQFNQHNNFAGRRACIDPSDKYLTIMANGTRYGDKSMPNINTNVWASGKGATDYYVFHGCDGAGLQSDCFGDIKYIEHFGMAWGGGVVDTEINNVGACNGVTGLWNADNTCTRQFTNGFTDSLWIPKEGICTSGKVAFCKFIHPGTKRVYKDYSGGWWGGACKAKWSSDDKYSKYGQADMGCIAQSDMKSTASGDKGNWPLVSQLILGIPDAYWSGKHPFASDDGDNFSFMLYDWACASDGGYSAKNLFSYPSITDLGHKCYVDNEPTLSRIHVYFGSLASDGNSIKLYMYEVTVSNNTASIIDKTKETGEKFWQIVQAEPVWNAPW